MACSSSITASLSSLTHQQHIPSSNSLLISSSSFSSLSFTPRRTKSSSSSFKIRVPFVVCKATPSSVVLPNLKADDFRHPLDQQNTLLLKAIPGLNELGKALLGTLAEQVMVLENIGTSVLVAENQLSSLHELMVEAAQILNIEAPDLYVRQSPVPNAYTLAVRERKPFVVVHTSLVELLTRKELQYILYAKMLLTKAKDMYWEGTGIPGSRIISMARLPGLEISATEVDITSVKWEYNLRSSYGVSIRLHKFVNSFPSRSSCTICTYFMKDKYRMELRFAL